MIKIIKNQPLLFRLIKFVNMESYMIIRNIIQTSSFFLQTLLKVEY